MSRGSATALQDGQETDVEKVHLKAEPNYLHSLIIICCNDDKAVCSPECENGGECFIPGHCACPSDWTGPRCEQGIHSDPLLPYESYDYNTIQLFAIHPVLMEVRVRMLESVHVSLNGREINVN